MVKAAALKKRYIAFKVKSAAQFDENELKHALYNEALKFFGEYGLSFVALKLISYDKEKGICVLRCSRDYYEEVLGFLALVNELNGNEARTIAIVSSGTLAGVARKIAKYNKY
jgi:RNase P/RNase MRP subunit POP5